MANLVARLTDPALFVDATTIDVLDESLSVFDVDYAKNGIVDARPEGAAAAVICAVEIGTVSVTAELWDGPPPVETGGWQDVAEVPLFWPADEPMEIGGEGTSLPEPPLLPVPGAGDYRVRVSGRNRDAGDPRAGGDPVEEYLIQVWPAPGGAAPAGPVTYKLTSRLGRRRTGRG